MRRLSAFGATRRLSASHDATPVTAQNSGPSVAVWASAGVAASSATRQTKEVRLPNMRTSLIVAPEACQGGRASLSERCVRPTPRGRHAATRPCFLAGLPLAGSLPTVRLALASQSDDHMTTRTTGGALERNRAHTVLPALPRGPCRHVCRRSQPP